MILRKLRGKALDFTLLLVSFALLIEVLPDWLTTTLAIGAIIACVRAMYKLGFFGGKF